VQLAAAPVRASACWRASIAPSAAPAPTSVCSSSMKTMYLPSALVISLSTALSRSSNSPRYLVPAISEPRSSATRCLFAQRLSGTSRSRCAARAPPRSPSYRPPAHRSGRGLFLGAPRQHLHHAADLPRPARSPGRSCLAGQLREVAGVSLERLKFLLGLLVRHACEPRTPSSAAMRSRDPRPGARSCLAVVPFSSSRASSRCSVDT